jgi:hypothetical protein
LIFLNLTDEPIEQHLPLSKLKQRAKKHGLNDDQFDSLINSAKQTIIKDLTVIPQKTKMTVLKESIKRIETLRSWIAIK